jgi:hypothetical protein
MAERDTMGEDAAADDARESPMNTTETPSELPPLTNIP